MSLSEFFNMGGYAVFVWSSYGLTLVLLVLNWFLPYQQHKQNLRKLTRQYRSGQPRQETRSNDSRS
ncbi:MAG: heme exporter protein CcmD [Gammaproteobacteria bacterium]|jgi:heme exporter protein D|nr:heme exporter protein CcmD [Gammaproteobacteria bacterium]MBT3724592.1 heme exporter protein CcmD [Gammaproteobacteria bacterium]MBT4077987.1 heme exporter protein CcmD [Gammaproteobacteria bacterium]MBT4194393.1 heme exporter protein CcmD [Gammaproteobacteria bacterium]MBT4450747.1 heme exporter protein CcmD [Gammaproteobacteria bacterium]